jgi:hypothetical protein
VRLDLSGEELLGRVVVGDRGEARGLRREADGREGRPVVAVAPDQLGGEVLGLRGAAAVAGREQAAPRSEHGSQAGAPGIGDLHAPAERSGRVDELPEVVAGTRGGVRHRFTPVRASVMATDA